MVNEVIIVAKPLKIYLYLSVFILLIFHGLLADSSVKQDGLEIQVKLIGQGIKGVIDFRIYGKNTTTTNKTLTGTILVTAEDPGQKAGNAVVYLEFPAGKEISEMCHAFVEEDVRVGDWELKIDAIYDFILTDLEADLDAEPRGPVEMDNLLGGLEELSAEALDIFSDIETSNSSSLNVNIIGKWQYSGDTRWSWVFRDDNTIRVIQNKNDNMLLMPDASGTYKIANGKVLITYDDLYEWPDVLEIRGYKLISGEYSLVRIE